MRLPAELVPYLAGNAFAPGCCAQFEFEEEDWRYEARIDVLGRLCRGKNVVHAGCVDHSVEMLERKRAEGAWLHDRLSEVGRRCYGVDVSYEGIHYMRETLHYRDLAVADVASMDLAALKNDTWDYLLVPELLEHVDGPVEFLRTIRRRYSAHVSQLIVSVPNAFARGNYRRAAAGIELINSDHRYWFTPYTISKVLMRAGFQIQRILLCTQAPELTRSPLRRFYYSRRPLIRDNIVLVANFGVPSVG